MMRKRSSSEQQQDSQKRKVDHGIVTTRHCSCKALLARRMGSASEKYPVLEDIVDITLCREAPHYSARMTIVKLHFDITLMIFQFVAGAQS